MGGPGAQVLLRNRLTPAQIAGLEACLRTIGDDVTKGEDGYWHYWHVYVKDTRPIGGYYTREGRLYFVGLTDPDDEPRVLSTIDAQFGFAPQQCLDVETMCNQPEDRRILGDLILHFARMFDGLIDFCGALLPRLPEGVSPWDQEWPEVESYFNAMVADMPGKVVSIPYMRRPAAGSGHATSATSPS